MLVYRESRGGLVLAEQAGDEAALGRALKRLDADLLLVKEKDLRHDLWVWKVLLHRGDDRPALHVLDWRDPAGVPLPLTSGIVDAVDAQRKDRPGGYDASSAVDAANERLVEGRRRAFETGIDDISDEFRGQLERGRKVVSFGAETKIPSWQRNKHLPAGVREGLK